MKEPTEGNLPLILSPWELTEILYAIQRLPQRTGDTENLLYKLHTLQESIPEKKENPE